MPKISADLEREIVAKAAGGMSARELSRWLKADRGLVVSDVAISKRLRVHRTDRADVAKAVVRETLGKSIPADLERLERLAMTAERMADENQGEPALWAKLADVVRKFTETKLHFSGADTPDDSVSELLAADERLTGKLARFIGAVASLPGVPDSTGEGTSRTQVEFLGEAKPIIPWGGLADLARKRGPRVR